MSTAIYVGGKKGVATLRSGVGDTLDYQLTSFSEAPVSALLAHPGRPACLFAGTRGDGVWRSDDAGATWRHLTSAAGAPTTIRCLALEAGGRGRLYVGVEPIDLWVSDDLGESWICLDSLREHPAVPAITYPVAGVDAHVRDIALAEGAIYLALQVGGMMKSTDDGASWQHIEREVDLDVHTIALDPRDPDHVVVATGGHCARTGTVAGRALYASHDGGTSWEALAMNFEQEYSVPLVLSPAQPDRLLSALAHGNPSRWRDRSTGAESVLVRSIDGGTTWTAADLSAVAEAGREMLSVLAVHPEAPETVYGALRNGALVVSHDGGGRFEPLADAGQGAEAMVVVA